MNSTAYRNAACTAYMYEEPKTNWTDRAALKDRLTYVNFNKASDIRDGGIPIISDGETAYIDTSDNHCAIFGPSGFKKTTCGFMPLIGTIASAGESFFALDPKGELYSRMGGFLKARGYKTIVLNFRDFNGDGYNPLHYPAKLWRNGEVDKASSMVSDLSSALAQKQESCKNVDSFWPETAKAFLNGTLPLMFDSYPNINDINFMSLADYFTESSAERLRNYMLDYEVINSATTNIKTILSEPERTRMSTLATCSSFIQTFIQNDKLCRMLSRSTFELEDLANEKTALFVITDDTSTSCNSIIATLISQLNSVLVDKAFHSENGKLSKRVNFILEEMCSLPLDLTNALATNRSRGIRYFLCIQSLDALQSRYPHYEGLLANCATTLFLGSTEMALLERISTRCGTTQKTRDGKTQPLISIPELMTLKKTWDEKEAIYFNLSEAVRYCATLPAIEQYKTFSGYGNSELPDIKHPPVSVYTFAHLKYDIEHGKAHKPFTMPQTAKPQKKEKKESASFESDIKKILESKFDELFGSEED